MSICKSVCVCKYLYTCNRVVGEDTARDRDRNDDGDGGGDGDVDVYGFMPSHH